MKGFVTIIVLLGLLAAGWYFFGNERSVESEDPMDGMTEEEHMEHEGEVISSEPTETYVGTLPAASSEGTEIELVLSDRGDGQGGSFTLTETYVGEEGEPVVSVGQWVVETGVIEAAPEAEVLVLTSESFEGSRYYERVDENTIRALATDGTRIESDLPYELELEA